MNILDLFTPTGYARIVAEKERKLALKQAVLENLKGGLGSGNFGHAGRPGKVGGSTSVSSVIDRDSDTLLAAIRDNPDGFSYRPRKGSPKTGYMVAIEGHELILSPENVTKKEIKKYVAKSYDIMKSNKRLHYGGWFDSETGKYVIDLSENWQSLKVAWNLAKNRKATDGLEQKAIFDLNTFEDVYVRGKSAPEGKWKDIYDSSPESEE